MEQLRNGMIALALLSGLPIVAVVLVGLLFPFMVAIALPVGGIWWIARGIRGMFA